MKNLPFNLAISTDLVLGWADAFSQQGRESPSSLHGTTLKHPWEVRLGKSWRLGLRTKVTMAMAEIPTIKNRLQTIALVL